VADPAADDAVIIRAHIAQLLVRKGYVANTQQAFARFVGASGPAYVEKDRLSVAEACSAIRAAGGVAVLAHAVQLRCPNFGVMERVVQEMTAAGLDGIEVYHPDHDAVMTRQCLDMARRLGLLLAGGSDFHGSPKQIDRLGTPRVPRAAVEPLMERLGVA
jgi:predicted metal-dependent phosphoesterase TrpH